MSTEIVLCYLIHAAQQGNSLEKHDLYQRLLNLEMHFYTVKDLWICHTSH